jgi:hypothetical protein
MNAEYADLKNTWGVDSIFKSAVVKSSLKDQVTDSLGSITPCTLKDLIDGMVNHVI